MQDLRVGQGLFFDRGIDSITETEGGAAALPERRRLAPTEQAGLGALEQLLAARSLESLLERAVQPDIADPELLLPHRFGAALERAAQRLCAARLQDDPQSPAAQARRRACRLLREEQDLRALLRTYMSALYAG